MPLSKAEFAALAKSLGPNATDEEILHAASGGAAPTFAAATADRLKPVPSHIPVKTPDGVIGERNATELADDRKRELFTLPGTKTDYTKPMVTVKPLGGMRIPSGQEAAMDPTAVMTTEIPGGEGKSAIDKVTTEMKRALQASSSETEGALAKALSPAPHEAPSSTVPNLGLRQTDKSAEAATVSVLPSAEATIPLEHRSNTFGLTEVDPGKFGSNVDKPNKWRLNYQTKLVPHAFFTRKGGTVEPLVVEQAPHIYDASIPASKVYDIGTDPDKLIAVAKEQAKSEWGDTSEPGAEAMLAKVIQGKGYTGYQNTAHPNPASRDTIALTKLNSSNMQKVAAAYDALEHKPDSPEVQQSYGAMGKEVRKQFDFLQNKLGITMEPWKAEGQPYSTSREMMDDVNKNKHLFFFTGGDFPAGHPTQVVDPQTGLSTNDMFRAVHDLFGHAKEGFQFGPVGEENAFRAHARMFSPEARGAMAMETKGQNSWVNFGPHGEANRADPTKTIYAEQKANVLPEKFQKLAGIGAGAAAGSQYAPAPTPMRLSNIPLPPENQGTRADGSPKGDGFLGPLARPDGSHSSELSVGVPGEELGGKPGEMEIPLLVPTLKPGEVKWLLAQDPAKMKVPAAILRKATAFARTRLEAGKPVFAQAGEANPSLFPELKRALPPR